MLSEKPWKLEGLIRLVMCLLICIAFLAMLTTLIQHFLGAKADDNSPLIIILSTLFLDGSILFAVFIFLRSEHVTWTRAFGFATPGLWRALMWGVIVAVFFTVFGQGLNYLCAELLERFNFPAQNEQAVESLKNATPGLVRAYLVFWSVVAAPVAEESLFRGVFYPTIKQCGFPRTALWGTSLLFGLIHFNLSAFLPLTLFALVLAILYEKTDNLLACITAHSVFNAAGVVLLYH